MNNPNNSEIEYRLKDDDIVCFLHIPKTGGTTLTRILDSYFDLDEICPERVWSKLLKQKRNDFSKFKLIRGHFGYGIHRQLQKKPIYVTMLRDPIEQRLSLLYRQMFNPPPHFKDKNPYKGRTLLEVLQDLKEPVLKHNSQTSHIGLDLDVVALTSNFDAKKIDNLLFAEILRPQENANLDTLPDMAKKRLSEFKFVGLFEKMERSMFLLYYTFGWKPISRPWNLNPSKKGLKDSAPKRLHREDLSKELIQKIIDQRNIDLELYEFAKELFENRYSKMVNDLKEKYYENGFEKLSEEETMYKMLEKHYQARSKETKISQIQSIDYDFSQKLSGSGWYWREQIPKTEHYFRWTGPETTSEIDLPLDTTKDLTLQFNVMRGITPEVIDSLSMKVNDHPIQITKLDKKLENTVFTAKIPKSILKNKRNFTRLSFEVSKTINPHLTDQSDPTDRFIGVAFDRIKIRPVGAN